MPISSFLTVYVTETVFRSGTAVNTDAVLIALANAPQVLFLGLVGPRLAGVGDKMGRLRPMALSVVAYLPVSIGLVWISELWHLAVFGLLLAVVGVVFSASFNSIVGDVYRARRGLAYGGLNMSFSLGAALGSTLGGLLFPLGWVTLVVVSTTIQATTLVGVVAVWRALGSSSKAMEVPDTLAISKMRA